MGCQDVSTRKDVIKKRGLTTLGLGRIGVLSFKSRNSWVVGTGIEPKSRFEMVRRKFSGLTLPGGHQTYPRFFKNHL